MQTYRNFVGLVDRQLLAILVLSLLATWVCRQYGILAELPTSLIGTAVVFPIVFSIHAAYRRREEALEALAAIQGDASTVLLAGRYWPVQPQPEVEREIVRTLGELLRAIRSYLHEEGRRAADRQKVHAAYAEVQAALRGLRAGGVASAEMSRVQHSMRMIHVHFEKLANVARYRTPLSLRAYSKVFLNGFPLLFAPNFALLAQDHGAGIGYGIAAVYSLVLGGLDNVQDRLEDPFDRDGLDDVDFDLHERQQLVLDHATAE